MPLIRTLNLSSGMILAAKSTVTTPNLQVQPVAATVLQPIVQSTRTNVIAPVHQQIIDPITSMIPVHNELIKQAASIALITNYIWKNPTAPITVTIPSSIAVASPVQSPVIEPHIIIPPLQTKVNVIVPAYSPPAPGPPEPPPPLHLKSAVIADAGYDSTPAVMSSKTFESYEQLTGILKDRPEIVMLTNFMPLFIDSGISDPSFIQRIENSGISPYMTDAGRYVDTYLQSRSLRYVDVVNLARNLRSTYPYVKSTFKQHRQYVENCVNGLRADVDFLFDLIKRLERMKAQLDLRDPLHEVNPIDVLRNFLVGFDAAAQQELETFAHYYMPQKFDFHNVLISLGYNPEDVKIFTSTKLWIQTLLELRDILRHHSFQFFPINIATRTVDADATTINLLNPASYYGGAWTTYGTISNGISTQIVVPSLSEMKGLIGSQVPETVRALSTAWNVMNQTTSFSDEDIRIAALTNLLSKEFRYSYGLSDPEVKRVLEDQFNYRVAEVGNGGVFDAIVGKIGSNITQFPAVQTDALTNISQRQDGNVGILTFEPKFIDVPGSAHSTITPGGSYYVDSVLKSDGSKFNTTRLEELTTVFDKSFKAFTTVVNGMNLMSVTKVGNQGASSLSNPAQFIRDFARRIIDTNSGQTIQNVAADRLGGVYAMALKNNDLKSALFMYALSNIFPANNQSDKRVFVNFASGSVSTGGVTFDNRGNVVQVQQQGGSFNSNVIKYIVNLIQNKAVQSSGTGSPKTVVPTLTDDTISSALRSGTTISRAIEATLQHVLSDMKFQDRILIDGEHTRINGYLDTAFLMMVFDVILSMAGRWCGQVINSVIAGTTKETKGTFTYNTVITQQNWFNSYQAIVHRLEQEASLTQQLIYTVLNTLQKLSDSFKNSVNYLNSQPTIDRLREVTNALNHTDMLSMLLSEQQIMILASVVQEMSERLEKKLTPPANPSVDGDNDIDAEDEFMLLDDALITPKVRDAVYGLFNSPDYVSRKGNNKKILTVGIPQGFAKRLKQRTDAKALNFVKDPTNKQGDIVSIVVYKIDLLNPDIVFKSKKMLFEMSRFPVRNDEKFLSIPEKPTPSDIFRAIPTRDFGNGKLNDMTYWSDGSTPSDPNVMATFADESYSFLTSSERYEIIKNHITSYLCDVYIKLMTGVNLADDQFNMFNLPRSMNNEMARIIVEHFIDYVVTNSKQAESKTKSSTPVGGVLFSTTAPRRAGYVPGSDSLSDNFTLDPAGIAGFVSQISQFGSVKGTPTVSSLDEQNKLGTLDDNLKLLTARDVPVTVHGLRTISNMAYMSTTLSDITTLQQRALVPRQFDRIFNIVIDTNDFEIDEPVMNETKQGAETFNQLVQTGDIIPVDAMSLDEGMMSFDSPPLPSENTKPVGRPFVQNRIEQPVSTFKTPKKTKSQGDLIMEKYFITVESYGEDD